MAAESCSPSCDKHAQSRTPHGIDGLIFRGIVPAFPLRETALFKFCADDDGTLRLHLPKRGPIQIDCDYEDGPDMLLEYLEADHSGFSYGKTWNLAEGFILSGATISGWPSYFESVRQDYDALLAGLPYYRDLGTCDDKARRRVMWERCSLAHSLSKCRYVPEEVPMPTFIEGPAASASLFRKMADAHGIMDGSVHEYFLKSFFSRQLSVGKNDGFSEHAWSELLDAGLVVSGEGIPLEILIPALSMAELKTALGYLGQKSATTKLANRTSLLDRLDEDRMRAGAAVLHARDWSDTFCISPPPDHDWMAFQSIRQQIKGMAVALTDLIDGTAIRRNKADYQILCGH